MHPVVDVLCAGKSKTKAPGNGAGADGLCGVQSIAGKDLGGRSIAITSNPKLNNVRCLGNIGGKLPGGVTIDDNKAHLEIETALTRNRRGVLPPDANDEQPRIEL